jgi:outer membrane protein OmpA-like peptidoglycan-associated protein
MTRLVSLVFLLGLSANLDLIAAAQEDHPLISRYQGSVVMSKKVEEFGEYLMVTGLTAKGDFVGEKLQGKVTRIVYQNPQGRSTMEIFLNYRKALEDAGMAALYACALNECGPAYARSAWNRYNGLFAAADGDPRYLAGKIVTPKAAAYVALMVGRLRTQFDVVEIVAMQEDLVAVDAAALARGIDREGRVSVYGIYFDTDKADIKPESKPALDEIGKLLKSRSGLKLYLVGHTDMTGALAHNRALSEARARAVVKALVNDYGIAAERLEGYGVGPLAPAASNATSEGKAKNRRVELVAR